MSKEPSALVHWWQYATCPFKCVWEYFCNVGSVPRHAFLQLVIIRFYYITCLSFAGKRVVNGWRSKSMDYIPLYTATGWKSYSSSCVALHELFARFNVMALEESILCWRKCFWTSHEEKVYNLLKTKFNATECHHQGLFSKKSTHCYKRFVFSKQNKSKLNIAHSNRTHEHLIKNSRQYPCNAIFQGATV